MIDGHAHLWQLGENGCTWPTPDLSSIYRDFGIDDLRRVTGAPGVDGVILVQSQEAFADTQWLLSISKDPLIAGIVGWIDFASPDAADLIRTLADQEALLGLRPMIQDRESDWYDSPALDIVFATMAELVLVLDALVRPTHLPSLRRLAERHPQLAIVIDHGAKPDFTDLIGWRDQMTKIAKLPNVHCKLSGLLTELPPASPREAIEPVFDILWNAFGAERLIWGSDWPVLTLAGTYESWVAQARQLVPAQHHDRVFDLNARRVYGLPV